MFGSLAASIISVRVAISIALIEIILGAVAGNTMPTLKPLDTKAGKIKEKTHV